MRPGLLALAIVLASPTVYAQQTSTEAPPAVPLEGMDEAALSGSARATKLIGSNVYKGDTAIGTIDDVLVELDDASLKALVLSVGGFLGLGNKLVAVPVSQIKLSTEAKFTTELTKEQLTRAPAFDSSKLK